ncbi:MAG: peptidase S8, partial [Alphaproteobacteria bacterium]
ALFESARTGAGVDSVRLGRGTLRARAALDRAPAPASALTRAPEDRGSFPILRLLLGLPAAPGPRDAMLELEALQLSQRSAEVAALVPEPWAPPTTLSPADRRRLIEALVEAPGVSRALRAALGDRGRAEAPTVAVPPSPSEAGGPDAIGDRQAAHAIAPALGRPVARRLRVYAYDPLMGTSLATSHLNEATLSVRWEPDLQPGPVGEYLEVVDVDPASEAAYAPVDLDHPHLLSQDGLKPSEGVPQFHQQMVYAVAMKTIEHFERALGRVALWAPHPTGEGRRRRDHFVRRLRIYPHALRERNAYYSPDRKALLFGYFNAPSIAAGSNLPGGLVFTCLSHDIVAHETTHALLDGLHRRYREPSNVDVLAFHEAFADVVALFQHFTVPEALRDQIARTAGDLGKQNLLGQLARQFGEASGHHGALRDAIAAYDPQTKQWRPRDPTPEDYHSHDEPHDRGAVLVAAVFDAFLQIYRRRSVDLVRLATGGTGVLPAGQIAPDLVERLAREASKAAGHVLNMCIRALDYCPPVDVTFGDYLRALITADRDLVPDDPMGYRIAFISAFRARGIFPSGVRSLAADSLAWEGPAVDTSRLDKLPRLIGRWDRRADRAVVFRDSHADAASLHGWLMADAQKPMREACGLLPKGPHPIAVEQRRADGTVEKRTLAGTLTSPEIHSVRPARRIGPDGDIRSDLVVEITQSWIPGDQPDIRHRGGATVLIDLDSHAVRFVIRKRVAHPQRVGERWQLAVTGGHALRRTYFTDRKRRGDRGEPFAMIHRRL